MNVNIRLAALIVAVAVVSAPALAQQTPPTPEERAAAFDKADVNKDGKLDMAEWKTTIPAAMAGQATDEQLAQFFARRDADKDGKLSKAEFTAPMQRPAQ
jgi:Ca2+-binding EF-hand superfamily protein